MTEKNMSTFLKIVPGRLQELFDVVPYINSSGDLKEIKDIDVIINSIINLLYIQKGTYIFDPEYGIGIQRFIFEPSDKITEQAIIGEVKNAIIYYESRAQIEVDVHFFNNLKGFRIIITVQKGGDVRRASVDYTENTIAVL